MPRTRSLLALTIAAVALAVPAITASSAPSAIDRDRHLEFGVGAEKREFVIDPDDRTSFGDRLVTRQVLLRGGEAAGHAYLECTTMKGARDPGATTVRMCSIVFDLPRSQVSAQAIQTLRPGSESFSGGVTGGQGEFSNVRGEILFDVGQGSPSRWRLFLTP